MSSCVNILKILLVEEIAVSFLIISVGEKFYHTKRHMARRFSARRAKRGGIRGVYVRREFDNAGRN